MLVALCCVHPSACLKRPHVFAQQQGGEGSRPLACVEVPLHCNLRFSFFARSQRLHSSCVSAVLLLLRGVRVCAASLCRLVAGEVLPLLLPRQPCAAPVPALLQHRRSWHEESMCVRGHPVHVWRHCCAVQARGPESG